MTAFVQIIWYPVSGQKINPADPSNTCSYIEGGFGSILSGFVGSLAHRTSDLGIWACRFLAHDGPRIAEGG